MKTEQRERYTHFIGGEYESESDDEYTDVTDPATGERITSVARGTTDDVDRAVQTARDAFESWSETAPAERGRILNRVAQLMRERKDELAHIESRDQGKPLSDAKGDIERSARYFEYYGGAADKLEGKSIPVAGDEIDFTIREPYGVSAQITPWNFPIQMAARGIAPALAAGNTAIVKPAPTTPLSTLHLAEICREGGVPDGVVNVVTGGVEAGSALSGHEDIDTITFTGSVPTGQAIMESAAKTITPVTLELGGKNPAVVFDDADMENAVSWIAGGIFNNAGQVCSAPDRAIVHESVYDEFVDRVVDEAESYEIGPGLDDPDMGPLNHEEHLEKVMRYIELGQEEGATLETGGDAMDREGHYVEPTVFSDVTNDMRIAQEEIFGPVLVVIPFSDPKEGVELANDIRYGLTGGVFSENVSRAMSAATEIDAGKVAVNEWYGGGIETPFGGFKDSGIGRENGLEGLETYLQTKNISINVDGLE
jgi:aldehyde dehydrogenase (NAD+)